MNVELLILRLIRAIECLFALRWALLALIAAFLLTVPCWAGDRHAG